MRFSHAFRSLVLALALSAGICAQRQTNETTTVPRLIRFNVSYHTASQPTQTAVNCYRIAAGHSCESKENAHDECR